MKELKDGLGRDLTIKFSLGGFKGDIVVLFITIWCMRRFAYTNFQITINVDSKLFYTPCYVQVR
jgi:hypothetical protein